MPQDYSALSPSKTTVMVAGGAGFVGSFLCEALLQRDCQVICIDNLVTGKKENIEHLIGKPGFCFIETDINNPDFLSNKNRYPKINYIFHLASVEEYLSGSKATPETLKTNSLGVDNLIAIAIQDRSKFLLCSSKEIYNPETPESFNIWQTGQEHNPGFLEAKRFAEILTIEYYQKNNIDSRIVRLGEVFGPRMSLNSMAFLSNIFKQVGESGKIIIPKNTPDKLTPLYVADVVSGILRSMFVPGTNGKIFNLDNSATVTAVGFMEIIKKIAVEEYQTILAFEYNSVGISIITENTGGILPAGWHPEYSFEDAVRETLGWVIRSKKENIEVQKIDVRPREKVLPEKNHKKRYLPIFAIGLISIIVFPAIIMFVNLLLSLQKVKNIENSIRTGTFENIKKDADGLISTIETSEKIFLGYGRIFGIIGLNGFFIKQDRTFYLAKSLGESLSALSDELNTGEAFSQILLGTKEGVLFDKITELKLKHQTALEKISLTQGLLDQFTGKEIVAGKYIVKMKEMLPAVRTKMITGRELLDVVPDLLGVYSPKQYLILFQNNTELRPGGGFIGSFGLVGFADGKMSEIQVYDVYSADGQLKGHVEPPAKLKELLGVSGWYLRDSNWSPDYPTNALRAEWFLNKELDKKVDGVIAINLFTVQKILAAIGEVEVPDFQEKINSDNLFAKAEYYSEAGFFPGSTQKGDFLGSLAQALMGKLKYLKSSEQGKILNGLLESIESKDVLLSFKDPKPATLASRYNWDGAIRDANCQQRKNACVKDYLMVNEANVGMNKANYYVEKIVNQTVTIGDDYRIKEQLNISYLNKSPSSVFPAGDYKTYVRVIVPVDSQIGKCQITDEKESSSIECKTEESIENNRKVFGIVLNVPYGQKRNIEISYSLADTKTVTAGEYLLFVQKQSGAKNDEYNLSLVYPESLSAVWTSQSVLTGEHTIGYNTRIAKDIPLQISFVK